MKIRRYTCKDMQEAMLKVKMDLGNEAVIMHSRKVKQKGLAGLFGKPMVEVVAAIDDDYVRPRPYYKEQKTVFPQYKIVPPHKAGEEHQGMAELQNKVETMEKMMKEIYRAVQTNSGSEKNRVHEALNPSLKTPQTMRTFVPPKLQKQTEVLSGEPVQTAGQEPAVNQQFAESISALKELLAEQEIEPKLIEKIVEKIKEIGGHNLARDEIFGLAERIMTVLLGDPEPITLNDEKKPHISLFIGPTGVGKTTTLAKIAADFALNRQKKVGLITADTYRIAAVEQLRTYAEILNIPVNVVYSPAEIKEAVERLSDNDIILIDTAGRSHKDKSHFDELKTLVSTVPANDTFLVMSCNTGQKSIREILECYAFIKNYRLLFTKLDESSVSGAILNARYMTGKPLSYTTAGQSVPDDFDIANVKQLVTGILGKSYI